MTSRRLHWPLWLRHLALVSVEQPTSPHGLRYSAITAALDSSGGDLRAAQWFSRHADPQTVGLYDDNRADIGGKLATQVSELV